MPLNGVALHFPHGGWVNPASLCRHLLHDIDTKTEVKVSGLAYNNEHWVITDASGATIDTADVVVLANGLAACDFEQTAWLSLLARRGQVSRVSETKTTAGLASVIAGKGFILPAIGGQHFFGATFDHVADQERHDPHPAPTAAADRYNVSALQAMAPDIFATGDVNVSESWTGLRCTSPDHLPLAGPVPVHAAYLSDYTDLHHGRHYKTYAPAEHYPGLFVLTALGSRGLVAAPLAAELVVSQALGTPLPVPQPVADALHPGRFVIRELKRKQT